MNIAQIEADATRGNVESQFSLAKIFDDGILVDRNLRKAVYWYQKAADQGHITAQKYLGINTNQPKNLHGKIDANKITKIYGPPGTGKTTRLISLVSVALSENINPTKIGYFSFTNKATETAKERMAKKFPQYDIETDFPYFQTIHSLASRVLRTQVKIITEQKAKHFDDDVRIERPLMKEGDENSQVIRIKHPVIDAATTARSLKISFKTYLENLKESQRWPINKWLGQPYKSSALAFSEDGIQQCLIYNEKYDNYKRELGVIDYADLLEKATKYKAHLPSLDLLIIDEAQDLSPAQWEIIDMMIDKAECVFLAGDDDQAICESIGGSTRYFLELPGHEKVLDESQRVPPVIHAHLNNLIPKLNKNPLRKEKFWKPKVNEIQGEVFYIQDENLFLKYLKINWMQVKNKDILLTFVTNSTLQNFSSLLTHQNIDHYAANQLIGEGAPKIRLLTIWGAKGGEADMVALITRSEMDTRMLREEPRLEYVAHSRAKQSFYYVGTYRPENVKRHPFENELVQRQSLKP